MEQHVVIVGGAGSVGHSSVEELAKYGGYKISVWTRKDISTAVIPNGAEGVQVTDYTDRNQLVKLLTGVNTVLAFINPMGDPGNATQKALIDACIDAKVRRFAPSEWAGKTYASIEMYKHKAKVLDYLKEVNKETTVLEYGLFHPGLLMDYLAHPYPPSKHTNTFSLLFDLLGARAVVVEDGSASMCFTAAADVGKVVAHAIQSDEPWPVEGGIVGEKVTMSDLVQIGEKVTGKSFEVHTVKAADLEAGEWKATWQPTFNEALSAGDTKKLVVPFISGWALGIYKGLIDLEPDWNRRFPNIKFTSVEEMLNAAWERAKADVKA